MTLPAYLACLRALAEKATPGKRYWTTLPEAGTRKNLVAESGELIVEPIGGSTSAAEDCAAITHADAAYLAAVDPQVVAALVAVAEAAQADRVSSADYHNETSRRLLAALDVLAAVAAPRQEDAR